MPPLSSGAPALEWYTGGSFRITVIVRGDYRVSISPIRVTGGTASVPVREMRSGSIAPLTQPLLLIDPRTDDIVVTLRSTGQ
jgi:hypothetical protein